MTLKFEIGQHVYKWTGDYRGPGIVRGIAGLEGGKWRYLVGHRLAGGVGELLHVYAEGNLRELDPNEGALPSISTRTDTGNELLDALVEAHVQVDMLMAMVIGHDKKFVPSQSPLWPEIIKRVELIKKHEATL